MRLWMVRGGRHGEFEKLALDQGFVQVGGKAADLSPAKTREEVAEIYRHAYPDAGQGRIQAWSAQMHAFANKIEIGDLVVMPRKGTNTLAFGKVTGPYEWRDDRGEGRHFRSVDWIRTDIPRTAFGQDLRHSLGAFNTVCEISRNNALARAQAVLAGKKDPGSSTASIAGAPPRVDTPADEGTAEEGPTNVEEVARDQIMGHLESHFMGHDLSRLVSAVLEADGYVTEDSPPGPDGGVDILAGRGALGFEGPRLCVQVKSSASPVDVTVLRALQGSMASFKAEQGLLVAWGGFTSAVEKESRQSYFSVRLWDAGNVVEAVFRNYERLPEEIQTDLPLKRIWTLVMDD